MEKNKITYKTIEGHLSKEELEVLLHLYVEVFKDAKPSFFIERLQTKVAVLSIIAFENLLPVGFKIGYKYNKTTFYSWVGGVLVENRKKGIATQMAKIQENWVKKSGYHRIRTKSMNQFKPMLILNIKNGFNIINVYTNSSNQTKIVFEKSINDDV